MVKWGHGVSENGTDVRTEDLQTLVAVADSGGLGAAARALGVPKSTVSRRLARLESTLGVQLLARSRLAMRTTEAGERVVERAREALKDLAALAASARGVTEAPKGRVRVSAPADLSSHHAMWLSFLDAHPAVALQVEFTNRYVDVVREGFDVAIRGGRGDDEALIVRRLGSYALRAVATPAWASTHAPLDSTSDLRRRDCVLLQPFRGERPSGEGARHVVFNQLQLVHEACLRGQGVAVLPAALVDDDLGAGRLVTVLDAYDPLQVPVYAAFTDRRFLPAATVALLDHLAEALGAPS